MRWLTRWFPRSHSPVARTRRHYRPRVEALEDRVVPDGDFGFALGFGSGLGNDSGRAVDASGNVYLTGSFQGTADFDPGPGTTALSALETDVFVAKYSPAGALVWARQLGGAGFDQPGGIAVDGSGNVYTTGNFQGTADFDPGAGTSNLTSAGDIDIFVSKLDSAGNFVYARQLGGTFTDQGLGIAVDGSGNVVTTGLFSATADFDPGAGTVNLTSAGSTDIFVSKLDSGGNFVYARQLGGTLTDFSLGIAVDGSGNVVTTGGFQGTADFDPGAGTTNLTSFGGFDIFVSKLDSGGNFVYARQLGGTMDDQGRGIAVDGSGNVYTTGEFRGTADFDPGAGTTNLTSFGGVDIFVSKLDSAGNFVYARQLGGTLLDQGRGIAVDGSGNVYTTGEFRGTADFDPGAGTTNLTSFGGVDIFVSKLDSAGNFVYARQLGGTGTDFGTGIAVDGAGNVYTTGSFSGTADFDPGAGTFNLTSAGGTDVFVSKLDSAGNFAFAFDVGAAAGGNDFGRAVATDAGGNVYVTGEFLGTVDFDPGPGATVLTSFGSQDVFVAKFSPAGALVWARQLGGAFAEQGRGIAVDGAGNVYTTGSFFGTVDFDPGAGTSNLTSPSALDIFVSKLDSAGNFVWARQLGGTSADSGFGIAVDGSGNVVTTGTFQGTADFDPGAGTSNLTSAGSNDIFVSKLTSGGNFVWAGRFGGTGNDQGLGIAADASGNVLTTGLFQNTADFDPGAGTSNLTASNTDIFVSKLDSAGNFVWARQFGGTSGDNGLGIAVDASGNVLTTGIFGGPADFDPGVGTSILTSAGTFDVFVSKLDSAGNFVWARRLGGTLDDRGTGIAVDGSGNVYTTGFFGGTADFDPGAGTSNLTSAGGSDIFVSKLDSAGNFVYARQLGGTGTDQGLGIAVHGSGNVYTTGVFNGTADFDPGAGTFNLTSAGGSDVFVSKLTGAPSNSPPTITSNGGGATASVSVAENTTAVTTVIANDPDLPAQTLTYSISGPDVGRFSIGTFSGVLTFNPAPDFENPTDVGANIVYDVTVQVSDGNGGTDTQAISVTVTNVTAVISGTVFVDVDGDGLFDGGTETGINGVTVELLNSTGTAVLATNVTELGGVYAFTVNDEFGTYRIREIQPTGVTNGAAILGSAAIDSVLSANEMQLTLAAVNASDYDFTEVGSSVQAGDTASIGFWQNKNGQALINLGGAALVNWLNANFGNIFGTTFSNGTGGDNAAEVASFYKNEFFTKKLHGTSKVDAQFMATALATFFTSSTLSGGSVAAGYGFNVTATGIGTRVVNIGSSGAAFNVANNTNMTIMALLLATNSQTGANPTIGGGYSNAYDTNGDGVLTAAENALRSQANTIYTAINGG